MDLIPESLEQPFRRQVRLRLLQQAARSTSGGVCWFQTAAPTLQQRNYWRKMAPIQRTIILVPPIDVALARQWERDAQNPDRQQRLQRGIHQWYKYYEPPHIKEPFTVVNPGEYHTPL